MQRPENLTDIQAMGVIGLMSGTSMDGLDCCYAEFSRANGQFYFSNMIAHTYTYDEDQKKFLRAAFHKNSEQLKQTDQQFGYYLAEKVKHFIQQHHLENKVSLIASHGHTIFHEPAKGVTVQIGNGSIMNQLTGIRVINDFRIKDVQLGGQGAPLVPVGDQYLFAQYPACLNLGGFSNISLIHQGQRVAFDISPCNLPLNIVCEKYLNVPYDHAGSIAAGGKCYDPLLQKLNTIPYYQQQAPKSLGYEWLTHEFMPVVEEFPLPIEDLLSTLCQHIGHQIVRVLDENQLKEVLVTGGGAYNTHLINILKKSACKITLPDTAIIDFKEALIFAFLGFLNFHDSINTFKSVTGAKEDSMGGIRHFSH
ncbi:MAG: anhydro-N-acetylmuramic acid kinase [Crocinitomicaceae bacterium]|nr:anhydro-N-acetylmuramic acid kinase [Crocinitomicaceae bacterium]MBK8926113.1 anhydro-N-acetylmuramic acid kinase [Crocinitomicaceae bacterium]